MVFKIFSFIKTDIWRIRLKDLPFIKALIIRLLRTFLLTIRKFHQDKCLLRASALTFYSLLSIGPVAALALGIAKGFGLETLLEKQLFNKFPGQEQVLIQIIDYAGRLIENTKGGMIAGFGVVVLFWSVLKVLGHIERSFNDIWGIRKSRALKRKISNYLAFMLITPILVLMSSSLPVFLTTQIAAITEKIDLIKIFSPFIFSSLKLLPYFLLWTLFTFIYVLMPNTKVKFRSGLLAGMVAGTIYQLAQVGYIYLQVAIAKNNPVYASLVALPLLLIWLQASWAIILIGAEVSFAHQNVEMYEFEPDYLNISPHFKKLLSLQIAHLLINKFARGDNPSTAAQISQTLEIPIRMVHRILDELVACKIISDMKTGEYEEFTYQPALDINLLTIKYIIDALDQRGVSHIPVAHTKELKALSEALRELADAIDHSPANRLLKDI
ncbi:MAG: YihY/virulence factor BrkB family protein [Thermodesulfobacteriota bacterium]|nr:YihY/virulence factor BrkB family protein [Thermodesulfobacteriota bacterium]